MSYSGCMLKKTILFIDDDERIHDLLNEYFRKNGFQTLSALSGMQGITILNDSASHVDMVILDIMLPEMDGFETLRHIKKTNDVPVIMLTAKDDETDRIVGLEMGADDYLNKPFNPRELLARIKAVLRRTQPAPSQIMTDNEQLQSLGITMNPATRTVIRKGEEIHLSTVEFDILYALMGSQGRVISRDELMTLARGLNFEAFDRSIDVHVSRIRKKIEPDPGNPRMLKTIWGKGYMWSDSAGA